MTTRPLIALTIGDPAGIGPEIVAAAVAKGGLHEVCRPLVIGDHGAVERGAREMGLAVDCQMVTAPAAGRYVPGAIDVLDLANVPADLTKGKIAPVAGQAAYQFLEKATALALSGEIDAIATAPLNKEALIAGGAPYIDHTTALAGLTGSSEATTMFVLDDLRIFFATRHTSLVQAIAELTRPRVLEMLVHADEQMRRFGFGRPRIALAALNPHGGESGLFGREEIDILTPAMRDAQERGINVSGPYPADSVFHNAKSGAFDCVMSLFHDQGHIAAKTLDFHRTTAITTGLPFVRSSVDHGTAFDIAGTGKANWISMAEAVKVGADFARRLRATVATG